MFKVVADGSFNESRQLRRCF